MNNNSQQNPERSSATNASDLSWLAFCYVANELEAQTRREFEIRLEHDQTAREAVAHAFDNAWVLNQALSQEASELPAAVCELSKRPAKRAARLSPAKSKPAWPTALLAVAIAGLLAMVLLQLQWKPAEVDVAQNASVPTLNGLTKTSISLAETWADSDWDTDLEADVAYIEPNLTPLKQGDLKQELAQDDEQDDWMTATLIDMAEDVESLPQQSGG